MRESLLGITAVSGCHGVRSVFDRVTFAPTATYIQSKIRSRNHVIEQGGYRVSAK